MAQDNNAIANDWNRILLKVKDEQLRYSARSLCERSQTKRQDYDTYYGNSVLVFGKNERVYKLNYRQDLSVADTESLAESAKLALARKSNTELREFKFDFENTAAIAASAYARKSLFDKVITERIQRLEERLKKAYEEQLKKAQAEQIEREKKAEQKEETVSETDDVFAKVEAICKNGAPVAIIKNVILLLQKERAKLKNQTAELQKKFKEALTKLLKAITFGGKK